VELADNYFGLAAGVEINIRLNANWLIYAGADMNQRNYYRQKSFDMFGTDERAGVIYGTVANSLRVGVQGGQDTMGTARYRDSSGINGEWRHGVGIYNQMNAFAQYRQYRFSEISMRLNDVDQQIAGIGWLHVFGNGNSTLSGSLYYGIENDVGPVTLMNPEGGRTDGAKRFGGFRVGGQTVMGGSTKLYFSGGEQFGKFEAVNPSILSQRSDRLDDLTLGANWYPSRSWTIRAQLTRFINMSNIDVYSFDRTDYSMTIRRNFN
jgi:hypothetical protein